MKFLILQTRSLESQVTAGQMEAMLTRLIFIEAYCGNSALCDFESSDSSRTVPVLRFEVACESELRLGGVRVVSPGYPGRALFSASPETSSRNKRRRRGKASGY
jgi:hypothetical protein